ncbi:hypothetical protein SHJG_0403 [Streptomyces hygroscopicus subsp. jinggangensis 5008]|nr:hypothetical protein SHJG_0403 [Streptomyces hygroscopicus subsp. jinggangensis 5008]AGF59903.1 hypothetical protein SHJGH_0237 [Streptomyces hygroscopicus subsp. jinggangensis TL01]
MTGEHARGVPDAEPRPAHMYPADEKHGDPVEAPDRPAF